MGNIAYISLRHLLYLNTLSQDTSNEHQALLLSAAFKIRNACVFPYTFLSPHALPVIRRQPIKHLQLCTYLFSYFS